MRKKENIRYNILISIIYILGIILILMLFNMQIIKGEYYREIGKTRLTKVAKIESARGKILDRNGIAYANTVLEYGVELFRAKIDDEKFNELAITLFNILEENDEKYFKKLPIDIEKFEFINLNGEEILNWKKELDLPKEASAEECFLRLKERYNINSHENSDVYKILELKELIRTNPESGVSPTKIAENIKRNTAAKLIENAHKMPGINISEMPTRKYERKEEAAHTIGYIAPISEEEYSKTKSEYGQKDKIGKNGIERTFEKLLKGKNGFKHIEMNVEGSVTGEYITSKSKDGADIILTIDAELQNKTENVIRKHLNELRNGKYVKTVNPKGASAIVMDVRNGDILAMVSYPEYEPQKFIKGISQKDWDEYRNSPYNPLINRSIQGLYSPGSTFKMATAIAALETGAVGVDEGVVCTGKYPKYHQPICWIYNYGGSHGWQNVSLAIKNSCNYFFYEMGDRMKEEKIADYAKYLGLGRKTGIEILGEEEGTLATKEVAAKKGQIWNPGDPLSAAIGQSYNSFTPLQIAKYVSMIANSGKEIRPTVIKSIIDNNGSYLSRDEINKFSNEITGYKDVKIDHREFKKENIGAVQNGMYLVTTPGGTAHGTFGDFNIKVAAKTGTAEAGNDTNGIFVSYAPYDNPEIAVVVIVENGYEGYFTSDAVKEIYMEYFGINKKNITENFEVVPEGETLIR